MDEFVEDVCYLCLSKGHGHRSVVVALSEEWVMSDPRLPEMRAPSAKEMAQGYVGDTWTASRNGWRIEVTWRGDLGNFVCLSEHPDSSEESTVLHYPHEVVDWIGAWSARLAHAR